MGSLIQNTIFGRTKKSFVSTWRTSNISTGSSAAAQIKLPLVSSGTYNFIVDWGDGSSDTITKWNQAETTHTYSVEGDYVIKITGICNGWQFNNTGDRLKILSIKTWGILKLENTKNYFFGCANLNLSSVEDTLDLRGTTNLSGLFGNCTSITTINKVNDWNTSAVLYMSQVFNGCSNFNQSLNNWNVSSVLDMSYLFSGTLSFNQDISYWNVSQCSNFNSMFNSSGFNNGGSTGINNWNIKTTGSVSINSMFANNFVFNQPLNNWNTIAVNSMISVFQTTRSFNQPLNNWNTSNVTSMNSMFNSANAFNQNIGAWNVSKVIDFDRMFGSFVGTNTFNNGGSSDINNWVFSTTSIISTAAMFYLTPSFNQPLNNWNTSKFGYTVSMFAGATSFNQDIGSWNVSNVTNFTNFMGGKTAATFSASNLDAIYNGWSSRPVKPNINLTFGTAKYTSSSIAGRAILTGSPNNWTITDGGI